MGTLAALKFPGMFLEFSNSVGWDVLPHPSYSPDFDLSDFHLFRFMENSLKNLSFENDKEVKSHIKNFFSSKLASFDKNKIMKLTEWWNKKIAIEGNYIIDKISKYKFVTSVINMFLKPKNFFGQPNKFKELYGICSVLESCLIESWHKNI